MGQYLGVRQLGLWQNEELPKLELPKLELPKLELPKLELPKIRRGRGSGPSSPAATTATAFVAPDWKARLAGARPEGARPEEMRAGGAGPEEIVPGFFHLRGRALAQANELLLDIGEVCRKAPPRSMTTPGGHRMTAELTNCGAEGWVSDQRGYRYTRNDPQSGRPWPALPERFLMLAQSAAELCSFAGFEPDACLINRYAVGARMSLHQDRNEEDMSQPIVSVSLGLPATFLIGGSTRKGLPRRLRLEHGDVLVWGGPARLLYHGVLPIAAGEHELLGAVRLNLTLRRARLARTPKT